MRRVLTICSTLALTFVLTAAPLLAQAAAGQAPKDTDGFVSISELPPNQQLPAAPYLVGAYAFIWVALLAYLWSIWRRLGAVERDMKALEQRRSGR